MDIPVEKTSCMYIAQEQITMNMENIYLISSCSVFLGCSKPLYGWNIAVDVLKFSKARKWYINIKCKKCKK